MGYVGAYITISGFSTSKGMNRDQLWEIRSITPVHPESMQTALFYTIGAIDANGQDLGLPTETVNMYMWDFCLV